MKIKNAALALSFGCVFLVSGCATQVDRIEVKKRVDVSGLWNDYDAQLVSAEMIEDSLKRPWHSQFLKEKGRNPVIIVGHVANRSHEHINTQVFTKYLERELLNSGQASFVANPVERGQLRTEREEQKGFTDPATIAEVGRERGADFMMIGSVDSVRDETKRKAVMFYQVSLELINLTTNEKVWIGQKQIKKLVTNPKFSI